MLFPTLVYRCPGDHQCNGGTFAYKVAANEDQLTTAIKDGWYPTLPFAQDPDGFDLESFLPYQEMVYPPLLVNLNREELEAKANELEIKFRKTTTDSTLIEKIINILKG